jgi:hypothetical protein
MSNTIRVSRDDKERLLRLAKRVNVKTISEALRIALEKAEKSDERFEGHLDSLKETLLCAEAYAKDGSTNVDHELAKALED